MKHCKCDFCGEDIKSEDKSAVSFGPHDLCGQCVNKTRQVVCLRCRGTGKIRVRDDDASFAQATYGENRTEYKIVRCDWCKGN